jgi:hypothetical protein
MFPAAQIPWQRTWLWVAWPGNPRALPLSAGHSANCVAQFLVTLKLGGASRVTSPVRFKFNYWAIHEMLRLIRNIPLLEFESCINIKNGNKIDGDCSLNEGITICLSVHCIMKRFRIVSYRPVAKRWFCKQRPLLGNDHNMHERNNRRTVFLMVRATAVSGQLLCIHVPAATDTNATIQDRYCLYGLCRDVSKGQS